MILLSALASLLLAQGSPPSAPTKSPALPVPAPTTSPAPAPRPPSFTWFTEFGETVLAKSDAVLLGRIESVKTIPGAEVVRVTVTNWYSGGKGPEPVEVTLLANPAEFFPGTEQLLFLRLYDGGPRYTCRNRVARTDPDWDAKLKSLEQNVALKQIEPEEDRRRQVRKLLYDNAGARESWTRWNMLRELKYLQKHYPGLVTKDDREDLRKLAERSPDADFRKALLGMLKESKR